MISYSTTTVKTKNQALITRNRSAYHQVASDFGNVFQNGYVDWNHGYEQQLTFFAVHSIDL